MPRPTTATVPLPWVLLVRRGDWITLVRANEDRATRQMCLVHTPHHIDSDVIAFENQHAAALGPPIGPPHQLQTDYAGATAEMCRQVLLGARPCQVPDENGESRVSCTVCIMIMPALFAFALAPLRCFLLSFSISGRRGIAASYVSMIVPATFITRDGVRLLLR